MTNPSAADPRPGKIQPPSVIKHSEIRSVINSLLDILKEPQTFVDYLGKEARALAEDLRTVPGIAGIAGLGYPFYAVDKTGKTVHVPEIPHFLEKTLHLLATDERAHPGGWLCPHCQSQRNLPDLKTYCQPCPLVTFKPRDLFKALPDVDLVIFAENAGDIEPAVERMLAERGYRQSDTNIASSLKTTSAVLDTILGKQQDVGAKLPIDVHIWALPDVRRCLDAIARGEPRASITSRSLHSRWEDNPLNFWFDFVFSLTELVPSTPELAHNIARTRQALVEQLTDEEIISIVRASSERATRLLSHSEVERTLRERLQSWRA